ncbi:hypothetical protein [Maritalea myrionectae]|uniref:hypothetical protein n=1 Tax=Maritalea myrionectae TaxID=454601 RepID=UPI000488EA02|nr:hypothetical protein [Maritalea myrionectae]
MSKRLNFEEALQAEFRWPQSDDLPFAVDKTQEHNAQILGGVDLRLLAMVEGYKLGADHMVEKALDDENERNMLVYPIIFNYRQFLELNLKAQIYSFGHYVGVQANWKTHNLEHLWLLFKEMLEGFGTEDPDQADGVVSNIVAEFSKIDPQSYSHRYPVDRNGDALPISRDELSLSQLRDVMEAVENYFSGCEGFLSNLAQAF